MEVKVLEVTVEQKDVLEGRKYNDTAFFNVVTDADGKFFIGKEERDMCDHEANPDIHLWIHDLPEITYNPVELEI